MSSETLMLSVCLAVAFGGVPLATLVHAHIAITRAARHVAEIEAIAASEPQHAEDMSRLGVRELQALAMVTVEELGDRRVGHKRVYARLRRAMAAKRHSRPQDGVASLAYAHATAKGNSVDDAPSLAHPIRSQRTA